MIKEIHKKIVFNEQNKPVEVIIDYREWQEIERMLEAGRKGMSKERLRTYAGIMSVGEEPMEYQRRMRDEWK